MRITSGQQSIGAQSLQMLKAQQAWEARRAQQNKPNFEVEPRSAPTKTDPPLSPSGTAQARPLSSHWDHTVLEIQDIARQSGFIGVTEQDIRRAYMSGQSLLADYRV